ncbi:hypothetical protein CLOP_g22576, partial [Closterium sp. NIES-67]
LPPERPQDHKIELEPGAQPTVRTQWRLTQPELQELRNQLDYLLAKGFIRPSTSPFAAPILFTPKKDGGLRMCTDYRALNRVTIKSRYPIPRTDELIDNLRGARYFSRSTFVAVTIKFGCSLTTATRPQSTEQNEATNINKLCDSVPDDLPSGLPPERPQDHKIELEPGAQPTVRTQWRLTQPELQELRNQLDYLWRKGSFGRARHRSQHPILFTPKKDGGLRMCTDYRALNRVTIKSRYPIPHTDELIDNLRGARYFSKIDLRGGYHQIRVFADDCHKTAFRTRYGSYEYTVMPFGLTNAPSTFQLTMNGVFRDLLDKCVIIYLDDILIYSKTREQHLKIWKRFSAVAAASTHHQGLQVRVFKTRTGVPGARDLHGGIRIDPKKLGLFRSGNRHKSAAAAIIFGFRELRGVYTQHGGVNWTSNRPTAEGTFYEWGEKQQAAFEALKNLLMSPPVLRIADPERPFEVITDASDIAIGAVLMQDFGNGLQPIAYESRKMQSAERNYPVHDKEMLAIVHAFKIWRCYLTGADVTVRTDHKSLQYLGAAESQPAADTLAGLSGVQLHVQDHVQKRRQQYCRRPFQTICPTRSSVYYLRSGTDRIWVPSYRLLRELLIQEVHDSNLSGHFGVDKTLKALQRFYYWPDMVTDVQRYVAACPICQRMKSSHQRPTGLLQPLEPPQRPWQHVTMDFVTGLPAGPSGNDAVLVVVDRLTKMAHFAPCRTTITAEETARLFISTVVRLHGIPAAIISDRDPKFTSKFWQDTWARYGTRLQFSSAYHPQTDGQTERTNQTMEQLIRTNCPDRKNGRTCCPCWNFPTTTRPQLRLITPRFISIISTNG